MSLYLEHITQRFGQTLALNDIDLEIRNGEFLAILGPSGCGKTTLLRAIGGFAKPTEGKIRMDDVIYSGNGKMVPVEQRDLGMVFQSFALWPNMTVRQHVEFPMKSPKQKHLTEAQKKEAVDAAIENMGLKPYEDRYPGELSGGQRQRVSLARAIVGKPCMRSLKPLVLTRITLSGSFSLRYLHTAISKSIRSSGSPYPQNTTA